MLKKRVIIVNIVTKKMIITKILLDQSRASNFGNKYLNTEYIMGNQSELLK